MSLLAERKRKQKWSLNPRGKEWTQDANKFGQKLLEKMGWQQGKGLGAKETGITEHIKVSYKNDSTGIGYIETNDQWTEHESNFSALLQSLTGEENGKEDIKVSSLEQKSQNSRARVHYHKFTRGKDLSRASEKDLANIFGRKSLKETKKPKLTVEKEDLDSKEIKSNSGLLINAGSMRDYFKKKLPNFGKVNGYVVGNNGVLKKEESESESELRPSFGFGFNTTETRAPTIFNKDISKLESEIRPSFDFINEDDTPSKKMNSKSKCASYADKNIDTKRKAEEKDDTILSPKKKSKKEKVKNEENAGVSNPAFNPMSTPIKVKKHLLETIEENLTEECEERNVSKSKKNIWENKDNTIEESTTNGSIKKNSANKSEFNSLNFNEETKNSVDLISPVSNTYEIDMKKLKKNKKNKKVEIEGSEAKTNKKEKKKNNSMEIDNPSFDETNTSQIKEEHSLEMSFSKSKKKKKIQEIDNPNFDVSEDNSLNVSQIVENPYEVKPKRKKQKKIELDNPNFVETENSVIDNSQLEENPYEVKLKKNKKQKKTELDNPNFVETENSITDISQLEENPYEVKPKKNKKQKKLEVVNLNYDETEDSETDTSQLDENPYEVKPNQKKKKKIKHLAIDNPSFSEQEEKQIDSINPFEVKSKKLKKKEINHSGIANPALNLNVSKNDDTILDQCDLILNVVSVPIVSEVPTNITNTTKPLGTITRIENLRNRKSVRFSDITQELIIPNNEELKEMYKKEKSKKRKKGLDNLNFDKQKINIDENVSTISKTLDNYQAEIENDMNEEKMKTITVEDLMVGEVGNPEGKNEKLQDGTKLKFKHANLDGKTAFYLLDKVGPKKSYKHLIKGDILVKFKNTNLHEIGGYGVNSKA